ncbi:hypothetical protein K431DRAFT_268395 [Polychaeton citri CBS 116435]|uniref:Uncharacterized protein n=1 Tax=Polychaeton citri CBS 116435 TaxID=1314669 RepID=A0A9P4UQK8_9PEZI|nr:hypothetical protein K431DRAFT_268395 [Polychaeton citri CBS 116435]
MSEEAVTSFGSIIESVPGWIAELEDILQSVAARQNQLQSTRQPCGDNDYAPEERPASRQGSSPSEAPSGAQQQTPQVHPLDVTGVAPRKRKTGSSISGHSGPLKYRHKSHHAIYYDGDAQKGFEKMVRNIGTCRNGIRKGKMTARIELLTRSGSSSSSDASRNSREYASTQIPKLGPRRTRESSPVSGALGTGKEMAVFDLVDRCLEASQSMCEKAAYQLLRDGECKAEITAARQKCIEAQSLAEAELPSLKRQAEKAARRRKGEEGEAEEQKAASPQLQLNGPKACSREALIPAASPTAFDIALEVDPDVDDDDSDEEKDSGEEMRAVAMQLPIGKFRQTRQLRGRLATPTQA